MFGLTPSSWDPADAQRALVKTAKSQNLVTQWPDGLLPSRSEAGWWPVIRETFTGAWQRNFRPNVESTLAHSTVWACITLIAADISKLRLKLTTVVDEDVWIETKNPAYSPVLRKPNHFENRIQFLYQWVVSKLTRGNTYVLKERDARGVVRSLYVLDPKRVTPLVAPNGNVYYELKADDLAGIEEDVTLPATEIIHDRMCALFHPLVGLSPLVAAASVVAQGLQIIANSSQLLKDGAQPGGIITAPHHIPEDVAQRIERHWSENYAGPKNIGKIAVLGDAMDFKQLALSAVDMQIIEQLNWGDARVCSVLQVPGFMVGVGSAPDGDPEKSTLRYYSQCLQYHIESIELCLDEGLSLPETIGVELDLEGLVRMDGASKMKMATDGVKGAVYTPNEARAIFGKRAKAGGDAAYLQQQNFSLEALAKRDAKDDPFAGKAGGPSATDAQTPDPVSQEDLNKTLIVAFAKEWERAYAA